MEKNYRINPKTRQLIAFLVIALSVVAIVVGILGDEIAIVLTKATNICLECIGLG